jgi:transcriptional regulator with XRE-family HTH domain
MTDAQADEFDHVRADPDPISRGRRATALLGVYQQRSTELARLRRRAIEEAHRQRGMTYTEIADRLGISKGRVTQIRADAPAAERAFFGVGPVAVGIPYRYQVTDRNRPLIAAEDSKTSDQVQQLLRDLAFTVTTYEIEPTREEAPQGDVVVICGPKSAPLGARLMASDPELGMVKEDGRWWIERRATGERFGSPSDTPEAPNGDVAYVARRRESGRVITHIAGIHAIGSLGAAHYLTDHLHDVYTESGDTSCSLVVGCSYDGLTISATELLGGPYRWTPSR